MTFSSAPARAKRVHPSAWCFQQNLPRLLLAILLLLVVGPVSANCGEVTEFHYASADAAADACRSHEPGSCAMRWGNLITGRASDGHRYYSVADYWSCGPEYWKFASYHFHFGACPEDTAPNENDLCVEPQGPSPEDYAEASNAGAPSCNIEEGNPIHAGTGNKYQREVDISGWSPFAAPLVRHYNSQTRRADGKLWHHTWQRRLAVNGFEYRDGTGNLRDADDTVALIRPDGRTLVFYKTGEHQLAEHAADTPDDIPAVGTAEHSLHWTGSAWRYRTAGGGSEYYDADGRLLRIVDGPGYTEWVEHDVDGRVSIVRDDFGRTLTFHYGTDGRLAQVIDPAGESYTYGYDSEDRLASVTDPSGATRTYHYGEFGAPADYLTGITDANGQRFATWQYDDEDRAVLSEHAGGAERVELEYLDNDRVRVTEADGGERTYALTTVRGRKLATSIDGDACSSCSQAQNYEYDDRGLVTRMTDRNGNVTTYQYNAAGLEIQRTEAADTNAARTITTEWDIERRLPLAVTESGRRTEYTYGEHGRVLTETVTDTASGASRTTSYAYHPEANGVPGQLAAIDGPRTDVEDATRFTYDADGNRVRVTNALGHVTEITGHDAYGRPTELIDPNGLTTTLTYDAAGRLVERTTGGRITGLAYDTAGNLTRVTSPDGSSLTYTYDAAHRITAIENEQGHRIEYTLDAQGNRTAEHVTESSGQVVREHQRVFDALGRLIRTVGAQGQTTRHAYDANGNPTGTTDPSGDNTQRAFDALDRLIRQTDALGGITAYAYDDHDRVTAVTDPNGNTTRYTYDGLGNRTKVDSPDAGITTYGYDAAGNVVSKTDARGKATSYTYDALNRRTQASYADGTSALFEWDTATNGLGRLARITEASGTTAWAYNRHGDIVERRQTADEVTLTTRHEYDAAGRKTATDYPSGMRVTYQYDADRITAIAVNGTTVLEGVHYAPFGPVAGWTWGDGDVHTRSFDRDGRLTRHSMPEGQRRLTYSLDGQITGITGPNVSRSYGYDALDRLIQADGTDLSRGYTYDANGNRLSLNADGTTTNYTIESGSNRLLASTGAQAADYTYDAAGNMTADGEHTDTYSARGRLGQVDGGDTATYRYNALGQRVYKHARMPLPDYAALATEAEARAERLAAEAEELQRHARTAMQEAARANREAAQARRTLQRAEVEARRAERAAERHRSHAQRWEEKGGRFAERAQKHRDLAAQATERASAARTEAENAQQELTAAEQTAQLARGMAKTLRTEARDKRNARGQARRQAAEYQRLAKHPPPRPVVKHRYVYDGAGQLIGVYRRNGEPVREYVRLGNVPVAAVDGGAVHYIHTDHLGTPRAVSQPSGPVVWRWISDPFGVSSPDEDPDSDGVRFALNLRFPGQYYDAETKQHYNHFRTYRPELARYPTPDPIGLHGGLNTFAYVGSNPVPRSDPFGLACGTGVCAAGGYAIYIAGASIGSLIGVTVATIANDQEDGSDESASCPIPGAEPGEETKGRTKNFEKDGDFETADDDFDDLESSDVRDIGDGVRVGTLPDGSTAIVRPGSTDGRPTIEIQRGKNKVKVRYGN